MLNTTNDTMPTCEPVPNEPMNELEIFEAFRGEFRKWIDTYLSAKKCQSDTTRDTIECPYGDDFDCQHCLQEKECYGYEERKADQLSVRVNLDQSLPKDEALDKAKQYAISLIFDDLANYVIVRNDDESHVIFSLYVAGGKQ